MKREKKQKRKGPTEIKNDQNDPQLKKQNNMLHDVKTDEQMKWKKRVCFNDSNQLKW